jgi:Fur family transcriptional regulator, ferric uptake regulator
MVEPLEQFKMTLKQHGQSLTSSRQLVFAALQDKEPQTMHEIVASCHDQVDRASVYRTIALFERLGIVQRLQIGWKYKLELSDAFHHHHHHLTCLRCGQIIPLPEDQQLEHRMRQLAAEAHFQTQDHQMEIRGLCQDCQEHNWRNHKTRREIRPGF